MTLPPYGFGIDFGTTNSVSAICERGAGPVRPLRNEENRPHPSVAWYRPDQPVEVGGKAKRNLHRYADQSGHRFITSIKRDLGKGKFVSLFGEKRESYEVAAEIFRFLFSQAKEDAGIKSRKFDLETGVVTVPIYFNGAARRDLRKAADAAGFYVKTFVHEPFAAVVGHLYSGGDLTSRLSGMEGSNILVFDWGGGTLDITVAGIRSGMLMELSTAGLTDRAGDLFDDAMMRWTRSRFLDRNRLAPSDINAGSGLVDRYLAECERAKISLSEVIDEKVQLAKAYQVDGKLFHLEETVTRGDFESLIDRDVRDALTEMDKAVEEAGLKRGDLDLVLLIGGSSRIPRVRMEIEDRFGARVREVDNADTVIAEGAAIVDALGMQPVLAQSVGVRLSDGTIYEVFSKGTVATTSVCQKTVDYFCTDNRRGEALLVLTEKRGGDTDHRSKEFLGIPVSAVLPDPYRHERVTLSFYLDHDLVLHVAGKGATVNHNSSIEIHDLTFGLSAEGAS